MNTLNKTITQTFFGSENGYDNLVAHWSAMTQGKITRRRLSAAHYLLYAVLRGRNWHNGFTNPTNTNKVHNGYRPHSIRALQEVRNKCYNKWLLEPFAGLVTEEALDRVRELLPIVSLEENPLGVEPYVEVTQMEMVV